MTYTTPTTRVASNKETAAAMNQDVIENIKALYNPPSNAYRVDEGADYTTNSTSFVDVDASPAAANPALSLSMTLTLDVAADVLIGFFGSVNFDTGTATLAVCFDVTIDGVRVGLDDGLIKANNLGANTTTAVPVSFVYLKQNLAAGAHTINLQWKVVGSVTAKLYAGAGTSNADVHPQFWAKKC